ncbi:hypothetical protein ACFYY8_33805 [Streptosporangium sp. NPDC001559]|uniref:hypothetical protein n=1 Tax=Streptosporangium sp. NPDC001559 TaxID=3366187 RepID=UPI0036E0D4D1
MRAHPHLPHRPTWATQALLAYLARWRTRNAAVEVEAAEHLAAIRPTDTRQPYADGRKA